MKTSSLLFLQRQNIDVYVLSTTGAFSCRTATRRRRQKKICSNKLFYKKLVFCYEWYQFNTAWEENMRGFILKTTSDLSFCELA